MTASRSAFAIASTSASACAKLTDKGRGHAHRCAVAEAAAGARTLADATACTAALAKARRTASALARAGAAGRSKTVRAVRAVSKVERAGRDACVSSHSCATDCADTFDCAYDDDDDYCGDCDCDRDSYFDDCDRERDNAWISKAAATAAAAVLARSAYVAYYYSTFIEGGSRLSGGSYSSVVLQAPLGSASDGSLCGGGGDDDDDQSEDSLESRGGSRSAFDVALAFVAASESNLYMVLGDADDDDQVLITYSRHLDRDEDQHCYRIIPQGPTFVSRWLDLAYTEQVQVDMVNVMGLAVVDGMTTDFRRRLTRGPAPASGFYLAASPASTFRSDDTVSVAAVEYDNHLRCVSPGMRNVISGTPGIMLEVRMAAVQGQPGWNASIAHSLWNATTVTAYVALSRSFGY